MDFFERMRPTPESTSIGHLLRNTTKMAMAPGITLNGYAEETETHQYYKSHPVSGGGLEARVKAFREVTAYNPSSVWVLDGSSRLGLMTASGPYRTQSELENFIIATERKEKTTRIFIVDGLASWSAAVVGTECRVPLQFFLETIDEDEQYVQLRSNESTDSRTFSMDNARIHKTRAHEKLSQRENTLRFDALGDSEIEFVRSHIFFKEFSHRSLQTAVVVFHEGAGEAGSGPSLVTSLMQDSSKSQRLCADINWLVSDVFHELNNWSDIIEYANMQLLVEQDNAKRPEIDLTMTLHEDTAMHIRLQEMLRVQIAVLESFVQGMHEREGSPELEMLVSKRINDIKGRLERYQQVLSIITRQTSNLISQVYNTISIGESMAITKITWITLIFLPLSFVASIFSMNVSLLQNAAPIWTYVVVSLGSLFVTLAIAMTLVVRRKRTRTSRRRKYLRNMGDVVKTDEENAHAFNVMSLRPQNVLVRFGPHSGAGSRLGSESQFLRDAVEKLKAPLLRPSSPPAVAEVPPSRNSLDVQPSRNKLDELDLVISPQQKKRVLPDTKPASPEQQYLAELEKAGPKRYEEAAKLISELHAFITRWYEDQNMPTSGQNDLGLGLGYIDEKTSANIPMIVISPPVHEDEYSKTEPEPLTDRVPLFRNADVIPRYTRARPGDRTSRPPDDAIPSEGRMRSLTQGVISRNAEDRAQREKEFAKAKQDEVVFLRKLFELEEVTGKALDVAGLSADLQSQTNEATAEEEKTAETEYQEKPIKDPTRSNSPSVEAKQLSGHRDSLQSPKPVRICIDVAGGLAQSQQEFVVPYSEVETWEKLKTALCFLTERQSPEVTDKINDEDFEARLFDASVPSKFWGSLLGHAAAMGPDIPRLVVLIGSSPTELQPKRRVTEPAGSALDSAPSAIAFTQSARMLTRRSFPELYLHQARKKPVPETTQAVDDPLTQKRKEAFLGGAQSAGSSRSAVANTPGPQAGRRSSFLEVDFEIDRALARSYSSTERMITVGGFGPKRERERGGPGPGSGLGSMSSGRGRRTAFRLR